MGVIFLKISWFYEGGDFVSKCVWRKVGDGFGKYVGILVWCGIFGILRKRS